MSVVDFTMDLSTSGTQFTGRSTEPNTFGHAGARFLYANIRGEVVGNVVRYVKTYDGTGGQSHSINYTGRFNSAWSEVVGTWRIGTASGYFELRRQ